MGTLNLQGTVKSRTNIRCFLDYSISTIAIDKKGASPTTDGAPILIESR